MVSKVASPFATVQNVKNTIDRSSEDNKAPKPAPSTSNNKEVNEELHCHDKTTQNNKAISNEDPNYTKDDILNQWLKASKRENNTITEDVDAEDADDQSRFSKATISSANSQLQRNSQIEQPVEEEEEENELHKIHMLQSLQALQYMKNIEMPRLDELSDKFVYLPPPKNPNITKTLIFDMDETLIHWVDDIQEECPQTVLDVTFEDGEVVEAGVNVRPYAIDCLKAANELFQVIVFTASHKWYADVVLDHIDPTGELIQYRLYRDSWYKTDDNIYIKDLRIIRNRELKDLVIGKPVSPCT